MKVHSEVVLVYDIRTEKMVSRKLYIKYNGAEEVLEAINIEYLANLAYAVPGEKITIEIDLRRMKR